MRFSTVVVDPPWRMNAGRLAGRAGFGDAYGNATKRLPYATMTVSQIAALPVAAITAEDAHLWLWTVNGYVEHAYPIARSWGFSPSTMHVWCKAPMGGGLGESFGVTTEYLLFARRGSGPRSRVRSRITGTWHTWTRRYVDGHPCHSKKPEGAYALIEAASHGPFVELFSRETQPRLGWRYWGHESLGTALLQEVS